LSPDSSRERRAAFRGMMLGQRFAERLVEGSFAIDLAAAQA
jgi:hypothetical protein